MEILFAFFFFISSDKQLSAMKLGFLLNDHFNNRKKRKEAILLEKS